MHSPSFTGQGRFDRPWNSSDVILLVEENRIHISKLILCANSPVFDRMLRESSQRQIPLTDVTYDDILELMKVIHPPLKSNVITEGNVDNAIKLADKYQMSGVLDLCEQYLLTVTPTVRSLVAAQNCRLNKLFSHCTSHLSLDMNLGDITSYEMVEALTPDTRIQLLQKRISLFENFFAKHAVNMLLQPGDNERQQTLNGLAAVHEFFKNQFNLGSAADNKILLNKPSKFKVTFDKPWDPDDIKLIVGKSQGEGQGEGRMVHVCKAVLCTNSPVFDKMLAAGVLQIHIDDETVGDIITIMEIIHPPQRVNVITGDNVHCVARLADKYEMGGVLELCEQYLLATDPSVQTLVTAQNHHLNDLKNQCILRLSRDTTVSELGHDAHYNAITEDTLLLLLQRRLALFERMFIESEIRLAPVDSGCDVNYCPYSYQSIRGLVASQFFKLVTAD